MSRHLDVRMGPTGNLCASLRSGALFRGAALGFLAPKREWGCWRGARRDTRGERGYDGSSGAGMAESGGGRCEQRGSGARLFGWGGLDVDSG